MSENYEYVGMDNEFMKAAYEKAKELYEIKKWNLKTTPVAVIVRDGKILSFGVAGNGMHPTYGKCDRLDLPGSPYTACDYCVEIEHAEQYALRALKWSKISPYGADLYLYGHWHMCPKCVQSARDQGIKRLVLLTDSERLFDRHHPDTVIGKPEQFSL